MTNTDWKLGLLCAMEAVTPAQAAWFRITWNQLARDGIVDGYDGAQCVRVLADWVIEGAPANVSFLTIRANAAVDTAAEPIPEETDR